MSSLSEMEVLFEPVIAPDKYAKDETAKSEVEAQTQEHPITDGDTQQEKQQRFPYPPLDTPLLDQPHSLMHYEDSPETPPNEDKVPQEPPQYLLGLLPFTLPTTAPSYHGINNPNYRTNANQAFSHMAAALLAHDHFNTRNPAVVPELAQLDCTYTLPPLLFENTGGDAFTTSQLLMQDTPHNLLAIVGPYTNEAALSAAAFTSGLDIPLVSHGSDDLTFTGHSDQAQVANVAADLHAMGEAVVNFALTRLQRAEAIATIHVETEIGERYMQAVEDAANQMIIDGRMFDEHQAYSISPPFVGEGPNRIEFVLNAIKARGLRNIFLVLNDVSTQLPIIADAVEQYGMNKGDYTWILGGSRNLYLKEVVHVAQGNDKVAKLVNGMAYVSLLDGFGQTPFLAEWKQQNATFVERVNDLHPVEGPLQAGYFQSSQDYFQTQDPLPGTGFMYDAVMSVGLGKCKELEGRERGQNNGQRDRARGLRQKQQSGPRRKLQEKDTKSGAPKNAFHEAIMDTVFQGATGEIRFGESTRFRGSRSRDTFLYGAYNFRPTPDNSSLWYYLTDVHHGNTMQGDWESTAQAPFAFATGLTTPPLLNRDLPEQNLLSPSMQIAGLAFMSIALLCSVLSAIFIQVRQSKDIHLRQDQPSLMQLLILGTAMLSLSIFTQSFDDSFLSESVLDVMCIATPTLIALGYNCVYLALFSKIWYLNKVTQSRNLNVKVGQLELPFAANMLATICILIAWSIVEPPHWVREEIDPVTHESYGMCQSNNALIYWTALFCLMALSTVACGLMAFKCRSIESCISDSKSVLHLIYVQVQVLLVGLPVLGMTHNDSASVGAFYLGKTILVFSIATSALALVILPKMLRAHKEGPFPKNANKQSTTAARISADLGGAGNEESDTSVWDQHSATSETPSRQSASQAREISPNSSMESFSKFSCEDDSTAWHQHSATGGTFSGQSTTSLATYITPNNSMEPSELTCDDVSYGMTPPWDEAGAISPNNSMESEPTDFSYEVGSHGMARPWDEA